MNDILIEYENFSNNIVNKINEELSKKLDNNDICIVTTGSFARGEASNESDMDYYVITKNDISLTDIEKNIISNIINKYVSKNSGDSGTFGDNAVEKYKEMIKNIGGSDDTNIKITRRMLFLLESSCLYNQKFYDEIMKKLIQLYIKNIRKKQITRFLLNDIIRYYRTITVDFEFKTAEKGKSWGLRNIKFTYSRKLIYSAGILCVAKTMDLEKEEKLNYLFKMFKITPLKRIDEIITDTKLKKAIFDIYTNFLKQISKKEVREQLNTIISINDSKNEVFDRLKEQSKNFSTLLIKAINTTFEKEHRIHEAISF